MTEKDRKKTLLALTLSETKAARLDIPLTLRRPLTIKQRLLISTVRRARTK